MPSTSYFFKTSVTQPTTICFTASVDFLKIFLCGVVRHLDGLHPGVLVHRHTSREGFRVTLALWDLKLLQDVGSCRKAF